MKAGWKNRIEERRYFEEKKQAWRDRCHQQRLLEFRVQEQQQWLDHVMRSARQPFYAEIVEQ